MHRLPALVAAVLLQATPAPLLTKTAFTVSLLVFQEPVQAYNSRHKILAKESYLLEEMDTVESALVWLVVRRDLLQTHSQSHHAQSSSYFTVNGTLYHLTVDLTKRRGVLLKLATSESLGFKILCNPGKMHAQSGKQQVQLDNYMHNFYRSDLGVIFQTLCSKGVFALSGDL